MPEPPDGDVVSAGRGWFVSHGRRRPQSGRGGPRLIAYLILGLLLLPALPGCGGCWRPWKSKTIEELEKEAEQRAKREEERKKRKEDFVSGPMVAYPQVSRLPDPEGARWSDPERSPLSEAQCLYKPGHWTAVTLAAKANNYDFLGELEIGVIDQDGRPMGLPGMPFTWSGWRTIALPKGQPKIFDSVLFVPDPGPGAGLDCAIHARRGGHRMYGVPRRYHNLVRMPAYQYHLIVLARWPERYSYVKSLDSVRSPLNVEQGDPDQACYRVTLLEPNRQMALPGQSLFWTSIACLIWDEVEPDLLRPDQQEALLDWLHWGGQLVLNGPATLEPLRHSFLGPYLPAASKGSRPITAAELEELDKPPWSPAEPGRVRRRLNPARPWTGVNWEKHPQAEWLPHTGRLLVERRVGRGRIVASAFPLYNPELTGWPGFDGLFNACLLRRPPRRFRRDSEGHVQVTWADDATGALQLDARRICNLCYFTRDSGRLFVQTKSPGMLAADASPANPSGPIGQPLPAAASQPNAAGLMVPVESVFGSDVASWSDFTAVAGAARRALQTAARIEIPGSRFVIWVVGAYLLVLVPLNWGVCRALGRVEWAWVAAPLIALICTLVVIRLAQLDIGFARSLTELAVVEMHGEYPRAHVTRYSAMYTSLSTRYTLRMEDPGALVQPFPTVDDPGRLRTLPGQGYTKLQYLCGNVASLRGFEVSSNSTGLAHSEQMLDLGGGIVLAETPAGGYRVANHTGLVLQGAGVIQKDAEDTLHAAWIGTLEPESTVPLRFRVHPKAPADQSVWETERRQLIEPAGGGREGRLDLGRLLALAEAPSDLQRGEVRLVAWAEAKLPGMEIEPAAPQARRLALVVAHLRPADLPEPKPDVQTRAAADSKGLGIRD